MRDIINFNSIAKILEKQNLKIDNKEKFKKYVNNYNFNTVIGGYSSIFYKDPKKKIYDDEATSDQIIDFYQFDTDFANHIIRLLLKIEKKLNTNVAYSIINVYRLEDRCLLKLNPNFIKQKIFTNLDLINPPMEFDKFIHLLVKYCDTNDTTKKLKVKNTRDIYTTWSEVPLDLMCLTWSFATTFSVFISLNEAITNHIAINFKVNPRNVSGFIDFIKNILYVRNLISHNYVIYSARIKYQSEAINELYYSIFNNKIRQITLIELLQLVEYFSEDKKLIKNTISFFHKLKIKEKFKNKIVVFMNYNH